MMNKANEFDNILDECLERVIKGEAIKACLESYPEYAAELEPLLRAALDTRKAVAITPRAEFRERASRQFQAAIREMSPRGSRGFFNWFPRWATVVSVVVVLLLAGSGTVAAANGSLPDSPLYAVKLATETIRLAFTTSTLDKAELYVKLTDKRVDEIIRMADRGKVAQVEQATERLNVQLIAIADLTVMAVGPAGEKDTAILTAPKAQMEAAPAPAPAPTAESPPPLIKLPQPEPVEEEVTIVAAPQAPGAGEDAAAESNILIAEGLEGPEKLKMIVLQRALENSRALQDILARVPESVRPALQNAIDVADAGYEQILSNLK